MNPARFLLLLSLFFVASAFSQTLEEQEKQIAAKNHIKSKTQTDFKYSDGKPAKTGVKSSTTTYSQSGEILLVNSLDTKAQVIGWEKYTYDANGNRTLFERDGSGSKYKKVSQYDAKNNILLETGFNGTENFRNEFSYVSGKLSGTIYMVNTKVIQKLTYDYSGNITNVKIYAGGTALSSKIKMVHDQSGNLIEETHYTVDGKETEKKTFKYNVASQITEEAKIQAGKLYYKITYEYDARGRLIRLSEETMAKARYTKKIYGFDASGNLIEYKWRRKPDEEFNIKTYTYDSKGVCLTEHTFYPGTKFELLSKFEYEYY